MATKGKKSSPKKKSSQPDGPRVVPPKKTGKRGIGPAPLDEVKDFDQPVKKESVAPAQEGSLLAEQPPKPTVVGDRIQMHFLKPTFSKTKKGVRLVALHLSFALTEEHTSDSLLPKGIRESWEVISKHGRKKLDLVGIPGQRAVFYMTHDIDDAKLTLPAAEVTNVSLAVIQKKGDGEAQKFIRLSFRLQVPVTHEVEKFAVLNYGADWWIQLEETDEPLFGEEDEE
jgi:hypothetical protein